MEIPISSGAEIKRNDSQGRKKKRSSPRHIQHKIRETKLTADTKEGCIVDIVQRKLWIMRRKVLRYNRE